MKTCKMCGVTKPLEDFRRRHGKNPDMVFAQCIPCLRDLQVAKTYKISVTEYRQLLAEHPVCDVCGKGPNSTWGPNMAKLHIDHSHATGRIRGMLCSPCNRALGYMEDDPIRLVKAADYLALEMLDIYSSWLGDLIGWLDSQPA